MYKGLRESVRAMECERTPLKGFEIGPPLGPFQMVPLRLRRTISRKDAVGMTMVTRKALDEMLALTETGQRLELYIYREVMYQLKVSRLNRRHGAREWNRKKLTHRRHRRGLKRYRRRSGRLLPLAKRHTWRRP